MKRSLATIVFVLIAYGSFVRSDELSLIVGTITGKGERSEYHWGHLILELSNGRKENSPHIAVNSGYSNVPILTL
jgi:hypothetical protein